MGFLADSGEHWMLESQSTLHVGIPIWQPTEAYVLVPCTISSHPHLTWEHQVSCFMPWPSLFQTHAGGCKCPPAPLWPVAPLLAADSQHALPSLWGFTPSLPLFLAEKNHRLATVCRDLWRSSSPDHPLLKQGHLKLDAQDHDQMASEYPQGWKLRLCGKPMPMLH